MQYSNNAMNAAFLPGQCLGPQEQYVDCADPYVINTNKDHCDLQMGVAQDVNDGAVDYEYYNSPNTPTELPVLCTLP
jgi:hypothetical protein